MPQLWLTDQELSEHFNCTPMAARRAVMEQRWPRKRSHDGNSRTLLPHEFAVEVMRRLATVSAPATAFDLTEQQEAPERETVELKRELEEFRAELRQERERTTDLMSILLRLTKGELEQSYSAAVSSQAA